MVVPKDSNGAEKFLLPSDVIAIVMLYYSFVCDAGVNLLRCQLYKIIVHTTM